MTTEMITNEIITAVEAMDPAVLGGIFLGTVAIIAAAAIFAVIRFLMKAIGHSAMYRKAGVAPWKAFIPFYNTYNNYKLAWAGKFFFLHVALYILFNALFGGTTLVMQLAAAAAGLALVVVDVKQNVKMAKLFGKGFGTGIALIFFPGITSLILGLGKAEFQGEMIEND